MSETEFSPATETLVRISEITVGERFRKKFVNIEELATSIKQIGLQNPIIITEKKELISGGRRLEAYKLMGEEFIPARVKNIEQTLFAEVDENNQREPFTISEKVAIAESIAEALKKTVGERRGRKSKAIDSNEDINPEESPEIGEETREFVAKKAGFGNSYTLRQARTVLANSIPEVFDAMDKGLISINYAFKISQAPKKKQLSLLNDATSDPATDTTELNEANKSRRKAKRSAKLKKPTCPQADPIYSIVRLAPVWESELFDDIKETPIHDYINPTCGVLIIECPNSCIAKSIELLQHWDLIYKATITVYTKKGPEDVNLDYINKPSKHLVIGRIDDEIDPGCEWVDPVFDRQDLDDGLEEIIAKIWADEAMTRIDMSSTTHKKGWSNWKLDYSDADMSDSSDDVEEETC
jgi:ParB family chromosome partitioning protein